MDHYIQPFSFKFVIEPYSISLMTVPIVTQVITTRSCSRMQRNNDRIGCAFQPFDEAVPFRPLEIQEQKSQRTRGSQVMKQASFHAHHRSSAVQTLFGRDTLKIRHLRAESITVQLQSFRTY